jgi:hypothetical protein
MAKNVTMSVNGSKLTIEVDLSKDFGPSASQKTLIIASTEGNITVEGTTDVKIGLNIYKPNPKRPAAA